MSAERREGHRFLEHTTDALVEAWGPTIERAFAQAAAGLFETLLNIEKVNPIAEEPVQANGHDEIELLYNWLEELLLRFELKGMAYSVFEVAELSHEEDSVRLRAKVRGERYDRAKHGGKVEIKGITYHLMEINRIDRKVRVSFLLDL